MAQLPEEQQIREGSFGFLIQTLARRIERTMKDRLHEQGVDIKIFANLMMLSQKDGITQRELGDKLDFPEYYTSRNIDALVDAGFAERRPDPNSRRSVLIYLTPAGRKKASGLPKIIHEVNSLHLEALDAGERKLVIELLQKAVGKPLMPKKDETPS